MAAAAAPAARSARVARDARDRAALVCARAARAGPGVHRRLLHEAQRQPLHRDDARARRLRVVLLRAAAAAACSRSSRRSPAPSPAGAPRAATTCSASRGARSCPCSRSSRSRTRSCRITCSTGCRRCSCCSPLHRGRFAAACVDGRARRCRASRSRRRCRRSPRGRAGRTTKPLLKLLLDDFARTMPSLVAPALVAFVALAAVALLAARLPRGAARRRAAVCGRRDSRALHGRRVVAAGRHVVPGAGEGRGPCVARHRRRRVERELAELQRLSRRGDAGAAPAARRNGADPHRPRRASCRRTTSCSRGAKCWSPACGRDDAPCATGAAAMADDAGVRGAAAVPLVAALAILCDRRERARVSARCSRASHVVPPTRVQRRSGNRPPMPATDSPCSRSRRHLLLQRPYAAWAGVVAAVPGSLLLHGLKALVPVRPAGARADEGRRHGARPRAAPRQLSVGSFRGRRHPRRHRVPRVSPLGGAHARHRGRAADRHQPRRGGRALADRHRHGSGPRMAVRVDRLAAGRRRALGAFTAGAHRRRADPRRVRGGLWFHPMELPAATPFRHGPRGHRRICSRCSRCGSACANGRQHAATRAAGERNASTRGVVGGQCARAARDGLGLPRRPRASGAPGPLSVALRPAARRVG